MQIASRIVRGGSWHCLELSEKCLPSAWSGGPAAADVVTHIASSMLAGKAEYSCEPMHSPNSGSPSTPATLPSPTPGPHYLAQHVSRGGGCWDDSGRGHRSRYSSGIVQGGGTSGFASSRERRCYSTGLCVHGGDRRADAGEAAARASASVYPAPETTGSASAPPAQPGQEKPLPSPTQTLMSTPTPHLTLLWRAHRPTAELLAPFLEGKPFAVAQIPGRGRGLVATRLIPAGQLVHEEGPMLAVPELGGPHGVCYHCLGPLALSPSPVRHRGPNSRRFCCDACLRAALERYLAVEEAAAAAAASAANTRAPTAATVGTDSRRDAGGDGGPLAALYKQCRQHGERFPLMAARLAFIEVSEAVRHHLRHLGRLPIAPATPDGGTAAAAAAAAAVGGTVGAEAAAICGDPLHDGLNVLCFVNVPPRYPEPWVEQHALLAAALRNLAANPRALQNVAAVMAWTSGGEVVAGRTGSGKEAAPPPSPQHVQQQQQQQQQQRSKQQQEQRHQSRPHMMEHTVEGECPEAAATAEGGQEAAARRGAEGEGLAAVVAAVLEGVLHVHWFVGVMARLHLNVFQVHNPLAGADPSDLAAAASALVAGTAGGASSGSAVYCLASLFNHSCDPTLELTFRRLDATAAFVAARDIAPGEELCVSYLDVGLPYAARRRHLEWSYGFLCECARCREEGEGEGRG